MSSLVMIISPSLAIPGTAAGIVPTPMTMFRAVTSCQLVPLRMTTVWGSLKDASPVRTSTPFRRSCLAMIAPSCAIT